MMSGRPLGLRPSGQPKMSVSPHGESTSGLLNPFHWAFCRVSFSVPSPFLRLVGWPESSIRSDRPTEPVLFLGLFGLCQVHDFFDFFRHAAMQPPTPPVPLDATRSSGQTMPRLFFLSSFTLFLCSSCGQWMKIPGRLVTSLRAVLDSSIHMGLPAVLVRYLR